MGRPKNILQYLHRKFGTSSSELADFLFIDRRTLYNYKNLNDEDLPEKVKQRILEYFRSNYNTGLTDMNKLYDYFDSLSEDLILDIYKKFVYTTLVRHGSPMKCDENQGIEQIALSLNVSETYLKSLLEVISNKLKSGNDYSFLEYIDKY